MAAKKGPYLKTVHSKFLVHSNVDFFLSESSIPSSRLMDDDVDVLTPNFWSSNEKVQNHKDKVLGIYKKLVPALSTALNELHSEKHDSSYWERLTGPWLWFYLTNFLEKHARLEHAFNQNPELRSLCLSPEFIAPPQSSIEYLESLRESDALHVQQYGYNLKTLFPNNSEEVFPHDRSNVSNARESSRGKTKSWWLKIFHNAFGRGYIHGKVVLFGTRYAMSNLIKLAIKSKFSIFPIFLGSTKVESQQSDPDKRNKFNITNPVTNNALEGAIVESLVHSMPIDIIERYTAVKKRVDADVRKNLPEKIVTGVGFLIDFRFAVWAATCAEFNTKIYGCQHGGLYGDTKMIADEYFERRLTDAYITWGWGDNSKLLNLPSQIFGSKRIFDRDPQKLLWVMTLDSRYSYHVEQMLTGCRLKKYFDNQRKLFESLDQRSKEQLIIRKYPHDLGWHVDEFWPGEQHYFCDNTVTSFHDNLRVSKLVIIDHIGGTTALECAAESIPFLIISDPRDSQFRNSAESIHEKLASVGLLHYDYDAAGIYINEILSDVKRWWMDATRQAVLNEYRGMYVRTDEKFIDKWLAFLCR